MEVQGMEEIKKSEYHLTSAAAFVEGGVQDSCDDACSICLEAFCNSDPSTLTTCKHEFHLQCILEWCQRSSKCPMCLQPINLKDPTSQELLESVERERNFRLNPSRNTTIFHHPTLGDFELQHLPVGVHDAELEERILQHLAAAAAMGNSRHIARRAGRRNRSSAQGHPQFLLFSTNPNAPPAASESSSPDERGDGEPAPAIRVVLPSPANVGEESSQSVTPLPSIQVESQSASPSASTTQTANQYGFSSNNLRTPSQPSPPSQYSAGPSDFQSFSESLKSRFNAMSLRYKESISKSTRDWKEKLFSRNTSMSDLGSEVKREVNAGIATVSHLMERLETRDNNRTNDASISEVKREVNAGIATVSHLMERLETRDNDRTNDASISSRVDNAVPDGDNRRISDFSRDHTVIDTNMQVSCATGSSSN